MLGIKQLNSGTKPWPRHSSACQLPMNCTPSLDQARSSRKFISITSAFALSTSQTWGNDKLTCRPLPRRGCRLSVRSRMIADVSPNGLHAQPCLSATPDPNRIAPHLSMNFEFLRCRSTCSPCPWAKASSLGAEQPSTVACKRPMGGLERSGLPPSRDAARSARNWDSIACRTASPPNTRGSQSLMPSCR